MISLSGLTVRNESNPDGDIEIHYTGLRPAEKLYEELLIGSNVSGTEHPMIMRALEPCLSWSQLEPLLHDLRAAMDRLDVPATLAILSSAVAEYVAPPVVADLVWERKDAQRMAQAKVTVLDVRRAAALRETRAD
jgi:FlaA1/EpsC-like NDP-sugar epimerase